MAESEVSAQGPDVIFALYDVCSILSLGFHFLDLRFPRFASWLLKVMKIRTENDRRALFLLLHKRNDMVTNISCCFFSRGPLGWNIFDIRLLPIFSPLVVHHQGMDRPSLPLGVDTIVVPDGFVGLSNVAFIFCLPVSHRVTPSGRPPLLPEWHPAELQPNRLPGGPCPRSSVAKVRGTGDHGPEDQVSSGNSKHHRPQFSAR